MTGGGGHVQRCPPCRNTERIHIRHHITDSAVLPVGTQRQYTSDTTSQTAPSSLPEHRENTHQTPHHRQRRPPCRNTETVHIRHHITDSAVLPVGTQREYTSDITSQTAPSSLSEHRENTHQTPHHRQRRHPCRNTERIHIRHHITDSAVLPVGTQREYISDITSQTAPSSLSEHRENTYQTSHHRQRRPPCRNTERIHIRHHITDSAVLPVGTQREYTSDTTSQTAPSSLPEHRDSTHQTPHHRQRRLPCRNTDIQFNLHHIHHITGIKHKKRHWHV